MPIANLNYAENYQQALQQDFPYVLNFGALYNSPSNTLFKWTGADTIKIPTIMTSGRVDANRDTIATAQRNYSNAWKTLTLENQRKWSTLVHPMDVDQTDYVTSITNITKVYNEEQKFPEMDAYCISKIYSDCVGMGKVAGTTVIDETNILDVFDSLMLKMDEARVPVKGRILYTTPTDKKTLKNAAKIQRQLNVDGNNDGTINRDVSRLDEVEIIPVPSDLMKTAYDFTSGWAVGAGAKQIHMCLIHPSAVITPVSYEFTKLDEPNAVTEGKYVYYEESHEDVFVLPKKINAIEFVAY